MYNLLFLLYEKIKKLIFKIQKLTNSLFKNYLFPK